MIDKSIAQHFLDKTARITTIRNYYFRGAVKTVSDDGILIDDIKDGFMFIAYSDIKNIENWKKKEVE